jgi:pilus assembly protein CpaB
MRRRFGQFDPPPAHRISGGGAPSIIAKGGYDVNRRILGVVLALVLASVGTWAIVQYVQNADERALEGTELVEVLVVEQSVPEGTPAEELTSYVATTQVPRDSRVPDALIDLDPVLGLVTATELVTGEQVLATRFTTVETLEAQRGIEVPDGLLEVTFTVSPERAVGGALAPGDLVAFVASFNPFTLDAVEPESAQDLQEFLDATEEEVEPISLKTPNTSHITIHKALVTRVQVGSESAGGGETETGADLSPSGTLLVTLAVEAPQVERVVFAAEFGRIWLAKEQPNSSEEGTDIITRANVYR